MPPFPAEAYLSQSSPHALRTKFWAVGPPGDAVVLVLSIYRVVVDTALRYMGATAPTCSRSVAVYTLNSAPITNQTLHSRPQRHRSRRHHAHKYGSFPLVESKQQLLAGCRVLAGVGLHAFGRVGNLPMQASRSLAGYRAQLRRYRLQHGRFGSGDDCKVCLPYHAAARPVRVAGSNLGEASQRLPSTAGQGDKLVLGQ